MAMPGNLARRERRMTCREQDFLPGNNCRYLALEASDGTSASPVQCSHSSSIYLQREQVMTIRSTQPLRFTSSILGSSPTWPFCELSMPEVSADDLSCDKEGRRNGWNSPLLSDCLVKLPAVAKGRFWRKLSMMYYLLTFKLIVMR